MFQNTPNEKLLLRYLSSISEKVRRQYPAGSTLVPLASRTRSLWCLNPRPLGHEYGDTTPPRVLQAAFTLGQPYVTIHGRTAEPVGAGYLFRSEIQKASGAAVTTGVFQSPDCEALSGLLCSRIDAVNQPTEMGADFQFVANPHARSTDQPDQPQTLLSSRALAHKRL